MTEMIKPLGDLALRTIAMPRDTNYSGQIFGGWLVSLMDLAGLTVVKRKKDQMVVTVAIDKLSFVKPVFVGDVVSCFVLVMRVGNTSTQVNVEAWVKRHKDGKSYKVTEGIFTYVVIDEERFQNLM